MPTRCSSAPSPETCSRCVLGELGGDEDAAAARVPPPLGDALIMAERNSAFVRLWLAALGPETRSGTAVLDRLRREHPGLLHVEPPASFFKYAPSARGICRLMRGRDEDLSGVLSLQPWSQLWAPGASGPGRFRTRVAHRLLRPHMRLDLWPGCPAIPPWAAAAFPAIRRGSARRSARGEGVLHASGRRPSGQRSWARARSSACSARVSSPTICAPPR